MPTMIPSRRRSLVGLAAFAFLGGAVPASASGAIDVSAMVADAGSAPRTATFIARRLSDGQIWQANPSRADARFSPASTSKIPHTLIALETGAATYDSTFKWDGERRWVAAWNRDQSLSSAFDASAVWVYQDLARRQGHETMARWIDRFAYGNRDIGPEHDLTTYWLNGRLEISAREQMGFLSRFLAGELPISRKTARTAKRIIRRDYGEGWALYAKTGWFHDAQAMDIGWYVGWTDHAGETYVFAFNLDMPTPELKNQRVETPLMVLERIGALPAGRG